ncbi:Mediator of RNA polymerase II transcription subunit 9-like [Heracleum sosnowskyi]|uniref:Mediator of RNA polymerase II transcription subunit 9-like n=1 Tax=Heracleum sosnowskyi TaxID=360622 RepID=A0AAD8M7R6_9APIA|nr:Mediator of RNA polymerase II transcription subunit 9-like [Heracleum sosnowskyi]
MRTIIYQSDVRANDPVGGCYRIIRDLQRQIEFNRAELELVLHQLAYCRAQNQLNNVNVLPSNDSGSFDIVTNNHNDNVQQYYHDGDDQDQEQYILHGDDQIHRPDDQDQDQEQYILHGNECDQVHFEEINSWEATGSSATLEAKKSYDCAENWQEDINEKQLSEEQREVLKFEAEEKSFDSVNNFRLKSTPAN